MSGSIVADRYSLPADPANFGGHADLFKAFDIVSHQHVAIKVFRYGQANFDPIQQRAWQNELNVYNRLTANDNLARYFDYDKLPDGKPFIVIEWLEGNLWEYLQKFPMEGWDDFWPIARDILTGLSAIHDAGFIHRDVKPQNILHDANGVHKVADFGTTRLEETVSVGLTVAQLGSPPYCPPEIATNNPTSAYDIYSFAVTTICCLASQEPADPTGVRAVLSQLDIPADVFEVLSTCLAEDPNDRPESASVLLSQLRSIQEAREKRRAKADVVFLDIPNQSVQDLAEAIGCSQHVALERLQRELGGSVYVHFNKRSENDPFIELVSDTLLIRLQRHRHKTGVLRVQRASRVNPELSDKARNQWLKPHIALRYSAPLDIAIAEQSLFELEERIKAHDQRVESNSNTARSEFASWRNLLQARFDLVKSDSKRVQYDSWVRDRNRVRFHCHSLEAVNVDEQRLVRSGKRAVVWGEIESIEDSEVVMYIERGEISSLPKSGVLEIDSTASVRKLNREQDAIVKLAAGKTTRADLKQILLEPARNRSPKEVTGIYYVQEDLDDAKKTAIDRALGAEDFLIVKGPPGTGKTTFIAELVAQNLRANPSCRILLSSQTHIALDNALVRIAKLYPKATLVRIGREEKLTDEATDFSLKSVLADWTGRVAQAASEFIRTYAAERGIDLDHPDIDQQLAEFEVQLSAASQLRSKIARRQAERAETSRKIEQQQALGKRLLSAAMSLEAQATAGSSTPDTLLAAEEFIRTGLEVAERLENDEGTMRRLAGLEELIREGREQLKVLQETLLPLRRELLVAVQGDASLSDQDLAAKAASHVPTLHPEIAKLQALGKEWSERFGQTPEFSSIVISESNLVAATCVGLGAIRGSDAVEFDLCILDEASKATATESLVPMVSSKKWILVGDQKQLPPFVEQVLTNQTFLTKYELTPSDARQTLFDVLCDGLPDHSQVALTHQHRMHPAIGRLISDCFYEGTLTSAPREFPNELKLALQKPVLWADTTARNDRHEVRNGNSFTNTGEMRVISSLLERLQFTASNSSRMLEIALLTGYEAQRQELQRLINTKTSEHPNLRIKAANVDSFQGQESDIAIFSIVRSNAEGRVGFLKETERLNVALSRGKDGLIIVGDSAFVNRLDPASSDLSRVLGHVRNHAADCQLEEF